MIIQGEAVGAHLGIRNIRQMSVESSQPSDSDASYEGYNVAYYISTPDTSPENLGGEEVVSLKSDEAASDCSVMLLVSQNNDVVVGGSQTVVCSETSSLRLQAQRQTSILNRSLNVNNIIGSFAGNIVSSNNANQYNDSNPRKKRVGAAEEPLTKRRRTGQDSKVTVVHPVKSGDASSKSANFNVTFGSNTSKAVYKCPICERSFETDKYLSMHLSLHKYPDNSTKQNANGMLQPQVVFDAETSKSLKRQHDATMTLPTIDGKLSATVATPTSPAIVTNSTNGHWTCPYCQKTFVQNSNFKNHVRTHSDERPFVCDICSIGFKERYHLKKHVLFKHTNDLKETCRVCGKCFKDSTAVRAHERIHSEVRPYGCTLCGKTFKTSECLWHHENRSKTCGKAILAKQQQQQQQQQHNRNDPNRPSTQQANNAVQPQKRPRRSKLATSLEVKSQSKCSIKNSLQSVEPALVESVYFDDSILEEMWSRLNEFESSQDSDQILIKAAADAESRSTSDQGSSPNSAASNNNAEVRPYKCKLCDNAFKLKVHLKKHHLYRHTNEYPCECSICGKRFKDTSAVRLHERIHSSERPFNCGCGKSFKTRENLWGHKNRGPCDSKFAQQGANVLEDSLAKGKMKLFNSSEFGTIIGVPIGRPSKKLDQNAEKVMRLEFIDNDRQLNKTNNRVHLQPTPTASNMSAALQASSNAATLKTTTIKILKTQDGVPAHSLESSGNGESSIAFPSHLNIPTAIVTPIRRSQAGLDLRKATTSLISPQQLNHTTPMPTSVSKSVPVRQRNFTTLEESMKCPTIHSLLMENKDKSTINLATQNDVGGLNSTAGHLKEPRILKLLNIPNEELAIFIPTNPNQQFSLVDLNPPSLQDVACHNQQQIPTMNTLLIRDSFPNYLKTGQEVFEHLATPDEVGDIFDFKVGDSQDHGFLGLKDVSAASSSATMNNSFDDIGQAVEVQSSSFDDICMSIWSSDSWLLGDEETFLDDLRLPEVTSAIHI